MTAANGSLLDIYQRHRHQLLTYVQARVGCPATAADIVQDTYLRLARQTSESRVGNPRAFVFRIARNLALDHLRLTAIHARSVTQGLRENIASDAPSAETALADRQRLLLLRAAIDGLPPRCREVFMLRQIEGLNQGEIAQRMGISRNMVEKHIRHGLALCMAQLDES